MCGERILKVSYSGGERGAREAARRGATVVVVDTFRASATIAVLVSLGARVRPVGSVAEALAAEGDYKVGERGGAKVRGFDFGNSPTEILGAGIVPGSTVVLTTTNGTRIIRAATGSPRILAGSFVNASAVAGALHPGDGEVAVIGCGWRGHRAAEDERAAGAIIARLVGKGAEPDQRARRVMRDYQERPIRALRRVSAARRLLRLGYEKDLDLCLSEDTFPVVPMLLDGAFADPGGYRTIPGALSHNPGYCGQISS
ncbi:2-phosphosulfolactate phosphatase [Rubrobacter calidifluminis]|uniref:2-phosphosulfolactate phosphatase n=1 Tax=Rubrobacter calidifluminis TaxID=1392640 RepID=UPI00235F63B1|nr:2-phosphosulfolactate phosphatase [Rubrobacter calidifluminis]